MTSVLFVWCRLHPYPSYRQGMHELLVPFVFCLEQDKLLCEKNKKRKKTAKKKIKGKGEEGEGEEEGQGEKEEEEEGDEDEDEGELYLRELMDSSQVEADAFLLFAQLMKQMKIVFETKPRRQQEASSTVTSTSSSSSSSSSLSAAGAVEAAVGNSNSKTNNEQHHHQQQQQQQWQQERQRQLPLPFPPLPLPRERKSPVLRLCDRIQNVSLRVLDPLVHVKLIEVGIAPQLYMLKWIRLLFLREFHIEDVMILWDG